MSKNHFLKKHFDEVFKNQEKGHSIKNIEKKVTGIKDKRIIQILKNFNINNKVCLDIGPGSGRWLNFMKNKNAKKLFAVDISPKVIDLNKTFCNKIFQLDIESKKLPLKDNSTDLILCLEVLEHIRDPNNLINELFRIMKSNSIAIFTIPNILSFASRVRVLVGLLPIAIISDPTHIKFYKKRSIFKIFSDYNFKVEFYSSSFTLNPFDQKSSLRIPSYGILSSLDDSLIFTIKKK